MAKDIIYNLSGGWRICAGRGHSQLYVAKQWADLWNNRGDDYYYKVFSNISKTKTGQKSAKYIIARKLREEM